MNNLSSNNFRRSSAVEAYRSHSIAIRGNSIEYFLTEPQINALTGAFQAYYDSNDKKAQKANRGRYYLTFLVLRYTGARIGEVLSVDDATDIDFRNAEIKLITLKQKHKKTRRRAPTRIIPVPSI